MKKLLQPFKSLAKGLINGAIDSTPLTLIKGIVSDKQNLSKAKQFLDFNQDGKLDINDVKLMSWELIGKLIALIAVASIVYLYVL